MTLSNNDTSPLNYINILSVAPIAIIGGTASVYTSALRSTTINTDHNSTTDAFTPLSMLYLLLLALNYAIMPRLSKRYIHPETNKQSVALIEEIVKMSLSAGGWFLTSMIAADANVSQLTESSLADSTATSAISIMSQQLQNWSPVSTLLAAGLPSALYALQGTLTYTSYQNLDPVTFNGLTQFKVLSSALCCYVVMGKGQSLVQMMALGLLMASTVVFQGSWKDWHVRFRFYDDDCNDYNGRTATSNAPNAVGAIPHSRRNNQFLYGVVPCISATLLSGLAGAFSQRSLQTQVGYMHRNAFLYTIEISFLSAVCLAIPLGLELCRRNKSDVNNNAKSRNEKTRKKQTHFFHHWTIATFLPITTKATAGILTALVHRHLGSVIKGFALVLGLVISALLQFVLEGVELTGGQLAGTALVLLSSWLHFTNPVR